MNEPPSGEIDSTPHCNVDEPSVSDNASILSGGSDTSEMEPFSDYLPKIQRLLDDNGLRAFSVEPLQHGYSFQNCVYALTSLEDEKEQYVLRVPVCPDLGELGQTCETVINEAALLSYLAGKLPVPYVKAYSATTQNALNTPCSIQTRLPGKSLNVVYDDLQYNEKLEIIDQFVGLMARVESISFAKAGIFTSALNQLEILDDWCDRTIPVIKVFDEGDEDFVNSAECSQDRSGHDVKTLIASHLQGWMAKECKQDDSYQSALIPRFEKLIAMLDELEQERPFQGESYPIVLYHWDLEPRNIMVEKTGDSWKICGIVDWDGAQAVPRPLARKPPSWIWKSDFEMCTGYLDNDHHPITKLSDDQTLLKAHFDAKAATNLPDYTEDAYERGRWLRRIWTLTKSEIHCAWYLDLIDQLLRDWDATTPVPQAEKQSGYGRSRWSVQSLGCLPASSSCADEVKMY